MKETASIFWVVLSDRKCISYARFFLFPFFGEFCHVLAVFDQSLIDCNWQSKNQIATNSNITKYTFIVSAVSTQQIKSLWGLSTKKSKWQWSCSTWQRTTRSHSVQTSGFPSETDQYEQRNLSWINSAFEKLRCMIWLRVWFSTKKLQIWMLELFFYNIILETLMPSI